MINKAILDSLNEAKSTLDYFLSNQENIELLEKSIHHLAEGFKNNHRVFSCGNGGSLCDAMHFAEELTGKFRKDRKPLPASAIIDPAHMTCVANDFGYSQIFSRYLEAWGSSGDTLIAISTSGNSDNVIQAVNVAKQKGIFTIGLLGKGGGKLKNLVDCPIIIPSTESTDRIQEMHIKILHIFIEGIERVLFPENYL